MAIYRGFEIEGDATKGFSWLDEAGTLHDGFKTEEQAMDDIDRHKRAQRAAASAA